MYLVVYLFGPLSFDSATKPPIPKNKSNVNDIIGRLSRRCSSVLEFVFHFLNSFKDLTFIGAILLLDYYCTNIYNEFQSYFIDAIDNYKLHTQHQSNITRTKIITQTIVNELNHLQEAVGFESIITCAMQISSAQFIDYSYQVIIFIACQRMIYLYAKMKWRSLPSSVCARFYREKHNQRIGYLKNTKIRSFK